MTPRLIRRLMTVVAGSSALLIAGATMASAHVTVVAPGATQGGYAVLTFRVPTESATASTTGLKVQLPPDQPLASASVQPKPGWAIKVTKRKLDTPIKTDDGEIGEAVSEIEWTATSSAGGIKPGQFDQFLISVGPLPKAPIMVFKAIQRYSDGNQVAWIEQAAAGSTTEPAHPAPTLTLAAAGDSNSVAQAAPAAAGLAVSPTADPPSKSSVTVATALAGVGIVLGLAALVLAMTNRRRPPA